MHALFLAAAGLALAPQDVDDDRGDRLVKVTLFADRAAVRPGDTLTLAIRLRVEPGWHIYWENPGDSGFPTTAEIRGPEGFDVGPVRFPAPHRLEAEGDIVTYVHEGEVVLLAEVRAPAKLDAGTKARFSVDCRWLVCTEVCFPGSGSAELELQLDEAGAPVRLAEEKLFAAARDGLPRPWKDLAGASIEWSRSEECALLRLTVRRATALEFYPAPSETVSLLALLHGRDEIQSRLTLSLRAKPDTLPDRPLVRGVLRVKIGKAETCYYLETPFDPSARPSASGK